ncbi:MAG: hypothetical protein H0S80_05080 [Desulfovibrionaceae bacterium]|nr:hypothetical protein [Desulfovibrionaceae bacterium]
MSKSDSKKLAANLKAGKLDGRTKPVIAMKAIEKRLEQDQQAAMLERLRRDIAVNEVIVEYLTAAILKNPAKPSQTLLHDLRQFQEQSRRAREELKAMTAEPEDGGGWRLE